MGVSCPEKGCLNYVFLSNIFIRTRIDRHNGESRSHQKRQSLFSHFKKKKKAFFSDGAHGRFGVVPDNILRDRERKVCCDSLCVSYSTRERGEEMGRTECVVQHQPSRLLFDWSPGAGHFLAVRWWPFFFLQLHRKSFVSESSESTEKRNRITSQRAIKKSSIIIANKKRKKLNYDVTRIHLFLWGSTLRVQKKSLTQHVRRDWTQSIKPSVVHVRFTPRRQASKSLALFFFFFSCWGRVQYPSHDLMIHRLVVHT